MPAYNYRCTSCGSEFSATQKVEARKESTCVCGMLALQTVAVPGFILKGDGWAGKNMTLVKQMSNKNRRLTAKSNDRKMDSPGMTLAPNVNGERVDSWSDAKKLAESKGKDGASYDKLIRGAN